VAQEDLFGAPAGWYPDPLGLPQLRWWNNHAWTEQTSAARAPMVVHDTTFAWADDDLPSRRQERERERREERNSREPTTVTATIDTLRELEPPRAFAKIDDQPPPPNTPSSPVETETEPDASQWPSFDSLFDSPPVATSAGAAESHASNDSLEALFGAPAAPRRSNRTRTLRVSPELGEHETGTTENADIPLERSTTTAPSSTGFVWVIAVTPVVQLVLALLVVTSLGRDAGSGVMLGIVALPYLPVVVLAYFDHKALIAAGNPKAAHWAWAFLTPLVYLIARSSSTIRLSGRGAAPLVVWIGLVVLAAVSVLVNPGLLIAGMPTVFADQIETSVSNDAALIAGSDMTVDCPPTPPVLSGEEITCQSVTSTGTTSEVTVTLARENGWIAWQVVDWGVYSRNES
jgi:hypothetical protein